MIEVSCCSMMRKDGSVSFNGAPPNKNMKRSMGFVMQVPWDQYLSGALGYTTLHGDSWKLRTSAWNVCMSFAE